MADIKDVSQAIHSALEEIGVHGDLKVQTETDCIEAPIGHPTGDDLAIEVIVSDKDAEPAA
jgi:hypothetical protein